jgi:hypothetical protein
MTEAESIARLRATLASDPQTDDLPASMDAVQKAVSEWWATPYMPWFTDHGINHSRRVAEYALLLADVPNLGSNRRLSGLELYILFVAAWVHDLGMQDLLKYGRLGDPIDFASVRHEHPDQTCRNVLAAYPTLGLPPSDSRLAEMVAYVARAHGTNYYTDSVKVLRSLSPVRGLQVRGPLLASLLLMADELDLRYERARPLAGRAELNYVSEAHAFKHRCVADVRPSMGDDGTIGVALTLIFPQRMSVDDTLAIERWISVKLRVQMGMVEPELTAGFGGQARFDRNIAVDRRYALTPDTSPSTEAMSLIRAETQINELINHHLIFQRVKQAITQNAVALITGDVDLAHNIDDQGREDLLSAVEAHALASGRRLRKSVRAWLLGTATAADVLEEWLLEPGTVTAGLEEATVVTGDEDHRRRELLGRLAAEVRSGGEVAWLLAISTFDSLPAADRTWLAGVAFPTLRLAGQVSIIGTATPGTALSIPDTPVLNEQMGELDRDGVLRFLGRYVSRVTALAECEAGLGYSGYKRIAQAHESVLRGQVTE